MNQKLIWASFLERLDAVFFVAPLDCFDEWSDDNENELRRSMDLWGGVVRNEMLARTPLLLIHNRIDLLREKLEEGVRVVDHVVSFKDRPNDVETVIACKSRLLFLCPTEVHRIGLDFRHYFKQIYKSSASSTRALRHLTSKLQSVGSSSSESSEDSLDDPQDRVFKAYVVYDVSYRYITMFF